MTKFNAILFAAALTADIDEEFHDLRVLVNGNHNGAEIRKKFNHLSSFLDGAKYALDYIADEEAKAELMEVLTYQEGELQDIAPAAARHVWGQEYDLDIQIRSYFDAKGKLEKYEVHAEDKDEGVALCEDFKTLSDARKWLESKFTRVVI